MEILEECDKIYIISDLNWFYHCLWHPLDFNQHLNDFTLVLTLWSLASHSPPTRSLVSLFWWLRRSVPRIFHMFATGMGTVRDVKETEEKHLLPLVLPNLWTWSRIYYKSLWELRKHRLREVRCHSQGHTANTEFKSSCCNSYALSSGHGGSWAERPANKYSGRKKAPRQEIFIYFVYFYHILSLDFQTTYRTFWNLIIIQFTIL